MSNSPSHEQFENDNVMKLYKSSSLKSNLRNIESLWNSSSLDPVAYSKLIKSILAVAPRDRTPAMIEKIIDWTKRLKCLQSLIEDNSEEIYFKVCQYILYEAQPKGSLVFKQGDKGVHFYIIIEGIVRIYKTVDGVEQELCKYSTGEKFGERALKYGVPRAASVQCLTDCEFLVLDKNQFNKNFDNFFDKKFNVLGKMFKSLPIFTGQSGSNIQKIGYVFRPKKFSKGNVVYKEGDPVNEVYFIHNGEFRLSKKLMNREKNKKKIIKPNKSNKYIELASMTNYELFGDEEIFNNLDYRTNSCYCYSNEGTLYVATKDAFLKNIVRNEEGYQLMRKRSIQKEESRKKLFEKSSEIFQEKPKNTFLLPSIQKDKEKSVYTPGTLTPINPPRFVANELKKVQTTSNLKSKILSTPGESLFSKLDTLKKYLTKPKLKKKKEHIPYVNMHIAKLNQGKNLNASHSLLRKLITSKSATNLFTEGITILTPKTPQIS